MPAKQRRDLAKCIDYPYTTPLCSNIVAQTCNIVKRNYYTFFALFLQKSDNMLW